MARHKKPTALKLLDGNPGRTPIAKNEPRPLPASIEPPDGMTGKALAMWERLAPELERLGMWTICDIESLEHGCKLHQMAMDAFDRDAVDAFGKLSTQYRMWAREFGFTPSSRAGLGVPGKKSDNPFDRFKA